MTVTVKFRCSTGFCKFNNHAEIFPPDTEPEIIGFIVPCPVCANRAWGTVLQTSPTLVSA